MHLDNFLEYFFPQSLFSAEQINQNTRNRVWSTRNRCGGTRNYLRHEGNGEKRFKVVPSDWRFQNKILLPEYVAGVGGCIILYSHLYDFQTTFYHGRRRRLPIQTFLMFLQKENVQFQCERYSWAPPLGEKAVRATSLEKKMEN